MARGKTPPSFREEFDECNWQALLLYVDEERRVLRKRLKASKLNQDEPSHSQLG